MKRFLIGVLIQMLAIGAYLALGSFGVPQWGCATVFLILVAISAYLIFSEIYTSWKEIRDLHLKMQKEMLQAQQNHDQQTRRINELKAQGRYDEAERQALDYIEELLRDKAKLSP